MDVKHYFEMAALSIEAAGVAVIVLGIVLALTRFARRRLGRFEGDAFQHFRSEIGRGILLGLEFLVAADIIATVSVDATLKGVAALAAIVAVRTFLSVTIELEITGRWPWQGGRHPDDG